MVRGLRILDPWRDFGSLQERINRMFDDTMRTVYPQGGEELERGTWIPAVDIHETEDGYVVKADLPGMKKEDIQIDLKNNTLTLKGEKKFEEKVSKDNYVRTRLSNVPSDSLLNPCFYFRPVPFFVKKLLHFLRQCASKNRHGRGRPSSRRPCASARRRGQQSCFRASCGSFCFFEPSLRVISSIQPSWLGVRLSLYPCSPANRRLSGDALFRLDNPCLADAI